MQMKVCKFIGFFKGAKKRIQLDQDLWRKHFSMPFNEVAIIQTK